MEKKSERKNSADSTPSDIATTKEDFFDSGKKKLNTSDANQTTNPFKTEGLNFHSPNNMLPYLSFNIDITLNCVQLFVKIKEILKTLGADVQEQRDENYFQIIKKDNSFVKAICSIFLQKTEPITIQCNIRQTEGRYDRIIELKVLTGEQINSEALIANFVKNLVQFSKKIKIIKKKSGFFNKLQREVDSLFKKKNMSLMNTLSKKKEEEFTMADAINKEASSYYEIYRIISQENYELGKSISIFINEFKIQNEKVETSSIFLPQQMKLIIMLIKSSSNSLTNYFNFGKSNTESMLKYSRPACEKFIFNKIYFKLFELYDYKYQSKNNKLKEKLKTIKENMGIEDIMTFLEIKEKFRCLDNYNSTHILPFKSTIDCINKIEYEQSPKDKIDTLINSGLDMRNTLLGCGGKIEINSMDDELPIFIYIFTQLNLKNVVAELAMIDDYLKYSEWEDKENKVLTNLMSSQEFILNSWNNY